MRAGAGRAVHAAAGGTVSRTARVVAREERRSVRWRSCPLTPVARSGRAVVDDGVQLAVEKLPTHRPVPRSTCSPARANESCRSATAAVSSSSGASTGGRGPVELGDVGGADWPRGRASAQPQTARSFAVHAEAAKSCASLPRTTALMLAAIRPEPRVHHAQISRWPALHVRDTLIGFVVHLRYGLHSSHLQLAGHVRRRARVRRTGIVWPNVSGSSRPSNGLGIPISWLGGITIRQHSS